MVSAADIGKRVVVWSPDGNEMEAVGVLELAAGCKALAPNGWVGVRQPSVRTAVMDADRGHY